MGEMMKSECQVWHMERGRQRERERERKREREREREREGERTHLYVAATELIVERYE